MERQQNWLEALNGEVTRVTMEEAKRKKIQLKPFSPISTPKNNTLRHSALSCHAKMNRNVAFVNFGVRLMDLVRYNNDLVLRVCY